MRHTFVAALFVTGVVAVSGEPTAQAAPFAGAFRAVASADGMRATVTVPHAPLTDTVMDAGGPSAQAVLDAIGTSQAFASFPYPGENVVTAPGLVAGASGGQLNLPAYPFYVSSDHPVSGEQEMESGTYSIKAESTDSESAATARLGARPDETGAVGLMESRAVVAHTETVTSQARTEINAFSMGPVSIGQVISVSEIEVGPNGSLERRVETTITGAKVGDVPVTITREGLVVGDSDAAPLDVSPVQEVLAQARVSVELMPRRDVASGSVAPAVRVSQEDESGMSVVYVLGGVSAFVEGVPATSADASTGEQTGENASGAPNRDGEIGDAPSTDPAGDDGGGMETVVDAPADQREIQEDVSPSGAPLSSLVSIDSSQGATVSAPSASVPSSSASQMDGGAEQLAPPGGTFEAEVDGSRATGVKDAPASNGSGSAQLATRLLVSTSDSRPLFVVLGVALALGLAIPALVSWKAKRSVAE